MAKKIAGAWGAGAGPGDLAGRGSAMILWITEVTRFGNGDQLIYLFISLLKLSSSSSNAVRRYLCYPCYLLLRADILNYFCEKSDL